MPTTYTHDHELFDLMRAELFTAVVGDGMDKLGFLNQFLPPEIQPVRDDMVLVRRAMPVIEADYMAGEESVGPLAAKPFGLMLEALDNLKPGEIYVASGSATPYPHWSEHMTTRAKHLGAVGALLNGYARDVGGICALDFPTFAKGRYARDQGPRGSVIDYRVPVAIGEVRIEPGSLPVRWCR